MEMKWDLKKIKNLTNKKHNTRKKITFFEVPDVLI